MDFDEDDYKSMDAVAKALVALAPQVFPDQLDINLSRVCKSQGDLTSHELTEFVDVIDACMGKLYVKHKGQNWRDEKIDELTEDGLVFLWYTDGSGVAGFMAFKLALELYGKTLYLYEIQILPKFQGKGLGKQFMDCFHRYAALVNGNALNPSIPHCSLLETGATSLTVFADNNKAVEWYKRLGYVHTSDSPADRRLRGGKVVKPSYYLLTRPLLDTS